ncbi:aldo/keto reductase [Nocardioides sp. BP30]|uniref:aldo/keto reductase n=1 Tax=Nocardioides sp. BP30 TaxID=3036374 RepID=UPI0024697004|nr:aldo/keto reductase [Nocardioides sp. BP30]WGL50785.1 aldo/keto reductase [Nocardioides sp. BP30]
MLRKKLASNRLGFGGAPLGNMFRAVPDDEAHRTVQVAWEAGVRFFDTAPIYGAGLSERRLGDALAGRPREDYVLATKVGRVVTAEIRDADLPPDAIFAHGLPQVVVDDYSADATLRSIEDSLRRLRTDRLDVVFVHDVALNVYGDAWIDRLAECRRGAFPVLDRLRDEGVIDAWGMAVNRTEAVEVTLDLEEVRPNAFLLAGSYTLLDHRRALERLLEQAEEQAVEMVVGGPYSSGALVGGPNFDYRPITAEVRDRIALVGRVAAAYDVSIKAVALQFCLAPITSAAVIPGATRPERVVEDAAALAEVVPEQLWHELRERGLIAANAPTPEVSHPFPVTAPR